MAESYETASLAARMSQYIPHAAALGLEVVSAVGGRGLMRAPWRADLVSDADSGVLASGVVTALLDHVCGLACGAAFEVPRPMATLDLRIDYMRPAAPRAGLTAEAVCYKLTRTVGFVRAQAWDRHPDDLVATAQASFMINTQG